MCERTLECFQASIQGKSLPFTHSHTHTHFPSNIDFEVDLMNRMQFTIQIMRRVFFHRQGSKTSMLLFLTAILWQIFSQTSICKLVAWMSFQFQFKTNSLHTELHKYKDYLFIHWSFALKLVLIWTEIFQIHSFILFIFFCDKKRRNELISKIKSWTFTLTGCTISVKQQSNTINLKMLLLLWLVV